MQTNGLSRICVFMALLYPHLKDKHNVSVGKCFRVREK